MANRGSSASTYDFSICVDTENRDKVRYPDTNDVVLNVDVAKMRRGTVQLYVGSAELPVPQYTIEPMWRYLCFDEGFRIDSFGPTGVPYVGGHTFIISDSAGVDYTVVLPPYLNPVLSVVIAAGTWTVTTQLAHGLDLRELWDPANPVVARLPISWVSNGYNNPSIVTLSGNPNVTVLTPFTFRITTPLVVPPTAFGYIHAPAVDSPVALAVLINTALANLGYTEGTFDYDLIESTFSFRTIYTGRTSVPTGICLKSTAIGNEIGILQCMGFISCCANQPICSLIYHENISRWAITGSGGPGWRGSIGITPGNYLENGPGSGLQLLGTDIMTQFGRLYFDRPTPPVQEQLLFSNALGTTISVAIPFGAYNPSTFATMLTERMNTKDPDSFFNLGAPNSAIYTVTFTDDIVQTTGGCGQFQGYFTFASTAPFGLEFGDAAVLGSSVASRMGYGNLPYRNGTSYPGKSLTFPVLGCQNIYYPHLQVNMQALTAKRFLRFEPTLPRLVQGTFTAAAASPLSMVIEFPVDVAPFTAPGFQVNDVVVISFNTAPKSLGYMARVTATGYVSSGPTSRFTVTLDLITIPAIAPVITVWMSLFQDSTTFNLYMNSPEKGTNTSRYKMQTIKPPILGFTSADLMAPAPFESVSPAFLEPPAYLLLQLLGTKGSSYIQHDYQGDNITNLLAKFVFFPTYQMQRLYPMQLTFNGSEILTQLHFRFLTPDHELYQFHGRNWSATLQLVVLGEVPILLCN